MKLYPFSFFLVLFFNFSAIATELKLPGETYKTQFDRFICRSFEEPDVGMPTSLSDMRVRFESLSSDAGLDRLKLVLTFSEDSIRCRYSLLFQPEPQLNLGVREESLASSEQGEGTCILGKAYFDQIFEYFPYAYVTKPHTEVGIGLNVEGVSSLCSSELRQIFAVFRLVEKQSK